MIGIENGVIDSAKRTIVFYQFSSRQYYEFGKGLFGFFSALFVFFLGGLKKHM